MTHISMNMLLAVLYYLIPGTALVLMGERYVEKGWNIFGGLHYMCGSFACAAGLYTLLTWIIVL